MRNRIGEGNIKIYLKGTGNASWNEFIWLRIGTSYGIDVITVMNA
jgi:hypothetical protein